MLGWRFSKPKWLFSEMVEVLKKMSNVGKVNSKLQCVKGILKLLTQIICYDTSTRDINYSWKEVLHLYSTVSVMIGCGFMFSL